jgi:hypothetical protein
MKPKNNPILVTGSHRSGTTWIGRTICQHDKVRYVQEPFHVEVPNKFLGFGLDTWYAHYDSSPQKDEIRRAFDRMFAQNPVQFASRLCASVGWDYKTPARFIKYLTTETIHKPRILVKDPIALLSADWMAQTYPFQVICMIRNPLGFIGSLKAVQWDFDYENLRCQENLMNGKLREYAQRIEFMCTHRNQTDFIDRTTLLWNILHNVILNYQKQHPDWLFVKHEDIAKNPEQEFPKVFDYLGLEMTPNVKAYVNKSTSSKNPKESSSGNYELRNSQQTLTVWKKRLTEEEVQRVNDATQEIASAFYAKPAKPAKPVESAQPVTV